MPRVFKGSKHVLLRGRVELWLTNATSGKLRCEGWDESTFPFMKRPVSGWQTKVPDSISSWPNLTEDLSITESDYETIRQALILLDGGNCGCTFCSSTVAAADTAIAVLMMCS